MKNTTTLNYEILFRNNNNNIQTGNDGGNYTFQRN